MGIFFVGIVKDMGDVKNNEVNRQDVKGCCFLFLAFYDCVYLPEL